MANDPAPFDEGVFLMRFHKGKEYFDQNKLPAALEELEAAHHLRPHDEKVRNLLGMTYFKLEMLPQAEEMYIHLAGSNPDIYTLHNNLGLIRLKLNKLDEAEESLQQALQLQPSNSKTHFYLGLLCEKREQWEEGLRHFEAAQADKMISKMRARIEEEHRKAEALLPFEVLEVLETQAEPVEKEEEPVASEEAETDLDEKSGIVIADEEMASADSTKGEDEITNRMLRQQSVQEIHVQVPDSLSSEEREPEAGQDAEIVGSDEQPVVEALEESEVEEPKPEESTPSVDWQRFVQAPDAMKLEEVLQTLRRAEAGQPSGEDENMPAETGPEQVRESEELPPWEKTEPEILSEEMGKEGASIEEDEVHVDKSPTIPIVPPFFLEEEMEADISTFLAQSREEQRKREAKEAAEEYSESPFEQPSAPEFSIAEETVPAEEEVEEEPFADRIPTPEEVEHQVVEPSEAGSDDSLLVSPAEDSEGISEEEPYSEVQKIESEQAILPIEEEEKEPEVAFSGWDEPVLEGETKDDTPVAVEPAEEAEIEELREDDAVSDEEEAVSFPEAEMESEVEEEEESYAEGHLEPSPLTPQISDDHREMTQEMSSGLYPKEARVAFHAGAVDVSPEEGTIAGETEDKISDGAVESIPEPEEKVPEHKDVLEPAKIDPFSRDRFYFQPLLGADRFLLMDPHLLEVVLSDELICRIGTISSYTGDLQFHPWTSKFSLNVPLVQVSGNGVLFMADHQKEIFLFSLNNEVLFVESDHLLVAQSALSVEPCVFQHPSVEERISAMKVSGRGTLALTCRTKPLAMNIRESRPASIPAHAIIAWSGELKSEVLEDEQLQKIMGPSQNTLFLRFTGKGDVVVEQGSLWKDPRSR